MYVLEVSLQAKLMGSEGCGGVRVSSNKTADNNNNCEKTRVEIERCSASVSKKGKGLTFLFIDPIRDLV